MERFGIFELLDALSSLPAAARENGPANYLTEEDGAPAAPAGEAAGGSAGNRASGGAAKGTGGNSDGGAAVPSPAPQALESFLRRHDTVSKKVDKKK